MPTVQQTGLGDFCEPTVTIPSDFAGQRGIVNVVADGPDGMHTPLMNPASCNSSSYKLIIISSLGLLYQCAAVSFVTGAATATPTACKNATGIQASYAADAALSSLPASATATASETSSTAAAASHHNAAGALAIGPMEYGAMGTFIWIAGVGAASFATFLL